MAAPALRSLPRFPLEQWEKDLNTWLQTTHAGHPLVGLDLCMPIAEEYVQEYVARHGAHPRPLELRASAVASASRFAFHPSIFLLTNLFTPLVAGGNGPGTDLWQYAVERVGPVALYEARTQASRNQRAMQDEPFDARELRNAQLDAIHSGLVLEEMRRGREDRGRDTPNAGLYDWLTLDTNTPTGRARLDRDTAGAVARMMGERIVRSSDTPHMPRAGPAVSRATILYRIATRAHAEAAIAAAQPPAAAHAGAVAALARLAGDLSDLVDSVAKKARRE